MEALEMIYFMNLVKWGFSNISCEQFEIIFLTTLNKHAKEEVR